ncbi:MAG: hypothetical protein NT069_25505 [Planctomycetota bacterium]|nr:hypothetical protein [Planctomycetota bacterium]
MSPSDAHPQLVDKSIGLLLQGVHLSFVDLFPPGRRDPRGLHQLIWSELSDSDFSPPADRPLSMVGYCAGDQVAAYVETAAVGEMFPDVPLFLTPTGHIILPLNETYSTTWNSCPEPLRSAVEGGSPS